MTETAPATGRAESESTFTGTGALVRFMVRRDRVRIPVWLLALGLSTAATASNLTSTYTTAEGRQSRASLVDSPAGAAFSGPGYGLDDYTYGAMMANELLGFVAIFAGLMSVLLVVRHTRAEEEAGRAELVRAGVVGRHAPLAAAVLVVGGANVALGALVTLLLGGSGIETVTWSGSLLFGAGLTAVGLVFTAVAAVTAQVSEYGRGASGLAGALLAAAYTLRAVGDMGGGALSWLSPIGWAQATKVYVDDRWWPLALSVVLTGVLLAAAFALATRRDVGAGLVPPRPGPRTASAFLGTPLGLALRLQRTSLVWWGVSMAGLGAVYGAFTGDVEEAIGDNEALQEWVATVPGASLSDQFVGVIVSMLAAVCAIQAILAMQRPRAEETGGRAEPVLATAVSRTRWLAGHTAVALAGGTLMLLLSGLGAGAVGAVVVGDAGLLPRTVGAALAYAPAVWITAGAALALFGLAPRALALAWAVVVYAVFVTTFGGLLRLPQWMDALSPFGHVPMLPGEDMRWAPLLILSAIAAGLVAAGFAAFRRRDLDLH
ncbi:ABC transporter permease [Actinomadura sp. WMMB 499]|uniref:ABC transporter permease n=1 Tax=Actinomadura sp. WMMB 499 TaxID=1219491 RepID=UPI0012474EAD|nr:ABC transporter permease [Actinomadura sp. WMMB 499]QFG21837.1 ABC transporter permease [Actinomadura sp. WMMB 499]